MELNASNTFLFWDGPLSQWNQSSFTDTMGGRYNCCEQYMMFHKALLFKDSDSALSIREARMPSEQKHLGSMVKGFDQAIWDKSKLGIVWQGNFLKFSQNESLKRFLLSTEDKTLVEASPFDAVWGVGMRDSDPEIYNPEMWRGQNLLGKTLMSVRDFLKIEV